MNQIFNIIDGPLANIYLFLNEIDIYVNKLKYVNKSTKEVVIRTMHLRKIKINLQYILMDNTYWSTNIKINYEHKKFKNKLLKIEDILLNKISKLKYSDDIAKIIYESIYKTGMDNFNKLCQPPYISNYWILNHFEVDSFKSAIQNKIWKTFVCTILPKLKKISNIDIRNKLYILSMRLKINLFVNKYFIEFVNHLLCVKNKGLVYIFLESLIRSKNFNKFKYCIDKLFESCPTLIDLSIMRMMFFEMFNYNFFNGLMYLESKKKLQFDSLIPCHTFYNKNTRKYFKNNRHHFDFIIDKRYVLIQSKFDYKVLLEMFIINDNIVYFKKYFTLLIQLHTIKYDCINTISKIINNLFDNNKNKFIKYILSKTNLKNIIDPTHIYMWAVKNNIVEYILKYQKYSKKKKYIHIKKYFRPHDLDYIKISNSF